MGVSIFLFFVKRIQQERGKFNLKLERKSTKLIKLSYDEPKLWEREKCEDIQIL